MNGKDAILITMAKLNRLDTASNRMIRPEMVLLFLNEALTTLVKRKYSQSNPNDQESFQRNQLMADELNVFTKQHTAVPTKVLNEYQVDISTIPDYYVGLWFYVLSGKGDKEKLATNLNYKTLDTVGSALQDPFNKPTYLSPIIYFANNKIMLPASDFEIKFVYCTYLMQTIKIEESKEITFNIIDEVIDLATTMILETWESRRVATKLQLDNME